MAKRRLQTTQTAQEEASTQLQTQGSSAPTDEQNVPDVPTPQHRRGTTQMSYIWNLSPKERIPVEFNSLIQPIKSGVGALHRFLGTMARRHNLLKINCTRWNEMDQAKKDECWDIVEYKFLFPSDASVRGKVKVYVMKKLGDLWRNYKAELKAKYFNPSLKGAEVDKDVRVQKSILRAVGQAGPTSGHDGDKQRGIKCPKVCINHQSPHTHLISTAAFLYALNSKALQQRL